MTSQPERLSENIWALGDRDYNLYLIRGARKSALYEVGVSAVADRAVYQLSGLSVSPDFLIVSHPHADHVTGLDRMRSAFPEARTLAGAGAVKFMAHPKAVEALVAEDAHMCDFVRRRDGSAGVLPAAAAPRTEGIETVEPGAELDLGGVTIRLLAAEGHSPGHLMVHAEGDNALLASDALGFHLPGRGFWPMFFTSCRSYLATLETVRKLDPGWIGMGHQGVIAEGGVREALSAARDAVSEFGALVDASKDDDALFERLFSTTYRDEILMNSRDNIANCLALLVRRWREFGAA